MLPFNKAYILYGHIKIVEKWYEHTQLCYKPYSKYINVSKDMLVVKILKFIHIINNVIQKKFTFIKKRLLLFFELTL